MHDEHVVCSRQQHSGGNQKFFSEHVVGHTSIFFCIGIVYVVMDFKQLFFRTARIYMLLCNWGQRFSQNCEFG
jgi:hypothetical protein